MWRTRRRIIALSVAGVLLVLAGSYLTYRERDNFFCVACYTQPETEYLDRYLRAAQKQTTADLAAFHYRQAQTLCIDCHGGEGVAGRALVELFAARNASKFFTGIARQPAVIELPLQNEACLKCHAPAMRKLGFENHMHNKPFIEPERVPFIRCSDCHVSHRLGDERTAFQFRDAILPKCEYCHATVGKGPRGLVP